MPGERQFLDLMRADLDNSVSRLVFADWLDEQGDPQGEFIRVQCELERPGLSALQHRWMRARERELLEEYKTDWLEPIAAKKLKSAEWTFRRGFVEEVTINAQEFIESGDFFQRAFPLLCGLNLRKATQRLVDPLSSCPALEGIVRLQLGSDFGHSTHRAHAWDDRDVLSSPIQRFLSSQHLKNLRRVMLADGTFTDEDLRAVLACPNLKLYSFDISNNVLAPRGMRLGLDLFQTLASASCMRELRELSLRSNGLGINHVLILTYSHLLGSLESLDLRGNPLGSQSNMIALVGLERFTKLKHLNLQSTGAGDAGVSAILKTPLWQQLESLVLWNNDISELGLIEIARSQPPVKLRSLEIRKNRVGDGGLIVLAGSPVLSAFSELHLEHNRIEDAGVWELARSDYAGGLRELHLRANSGISDRGAAAIVSAGFPFLEVLDLAATGAGDATAIAIAESPASASLRVLDLGGTRITKAGAAAIANSPHLDSLEFLDLRMNHLSGDCVTALADRFPRRLLL